MVRPIQAALLSGEALYREVVLQRMARARESLWIATANVKAMFIQGPDGGFRSVLDLFAELGRRGVELRLLHAELPSGPFRDAFDQHRSLWNRLELKICPRVHFKAVLVDGAWIYLGSANLTGAGLGAKGPHKRNFELGFVTEDFDVIDRATALFESVWSGVECARCQLYDVCPDPIGPRARRSKGVELGRSRKLIMASARPRPSRS
ncbi:MAG TPA: phospholipase D family protein [Myxococcales bacterium]|nr:phospholipase D family protein [Myxococcales bacterium]